MEVQTPVVASHGMTGWILEDQIFQKREPELPTDGVRRTVVHGGERVDGSAPSVISGHRDGGSCSSRRDATSLEPRQYRPADLVNDLIAPGAFPVSDPPHSLTGGENDPELWTLREIGTAEVAGVPFRDLGRTLGSTDVLRHVGIAKQSLEKRKILALPWLDPHAIRFGVRRIVSRRHGPTRTGTASRPW